MKSASKLRLWINRDNGRYFRVGNEAISGLTVAGTVIGISTLVLWQLQAQALIPTGWALASSILAIVFFVLGHTNGSGQSGT